MVILGLLTGLALAAEVQLVGGAVLEAEIGALELGGDCVLDVVGGELAGARVVVPCSDVLRVSRSPSRAESIELLDGQAPPVLYIAEEEEPGVLLSGTGPAEALETEVVQAAPAPAVVLALPVDAPLAAQPLDPDTPVGLIEEAEVVQAVVDPAPVKLDPSPAPAVRRAALPADMVPPGAAWSQAATEPLVAPEVPPEPAAAPAVEPEPAQEPALAAEPHAPLPVARARPATARPGAAPAPEAVNPEDEPLVPAGHFRAAPSMP